MDDLNAILTAIFEFIRGLPDLLLGLLGVLNNAPEPYRGLLLAVFWVVMVLLPMGWMAFKILSSKPYRSAYRLIGRVMAALFKSMKSDLELPQPSPWISRIIQPLAMLVGYFGAFICLLFLMAVFVLLVLSNQPDTAALLGGVGMLAVSGYFVWLCFAIGERARLNLFRRQQHG